MDLFSRLQLDPEEEPSSEAARALTLIDLQPRLRRFLPANLQRRLGLDDDPLPDPGLGTLTEAAGTLRSLYHSLTTYVPHCLVERVEQDPVPGLVRGTFLDGTVLFADISGFTRMSARLGQQGPAGAEELTDIVNHYFSEMLDILARSGGDLLKFAGDAMLAYFPAFRREGETEVDWAIRAGLRMQRAMTAFQLIETSQGAFPLHMKVSLASGRFLAAQVGTDERMEFGVLGPAVQAVMAADGVAESGQVIVAPSTRPRVRSEFVARPHHDDFLAVEVDQPFELDDFELRTVGRRSVFLPAREVSALLRQIGEELDRLASLAPYLAPELVDRLVAGGKQRRVESEYRATTILFSNFAGPENYFADVVHRGDGAQILTTVLDHYFSQAQKIIADHGGVISRLDPYNWGSRLLVLFGAPVTHEDDPQRAVATALAIRDHLPDIDAIARSTLARHGVPVSADVPIFRQRAGITLGTTFAGEAGSRNRREYTVMGDEVNMAARFVVASQPGQILLSQRVQKRVGPGFLLRAHDPVRVKGKSEPVLVYEARGRRRVTPMDVRPHAPLYGRDHEMQVAQAALDDVVAGQGRILILEGDAGMGKTRLAQEIAARAMDRGCLVLWGTAVGYGDAPPYAPWREILADLLQIAPGTRIVELENRLRALGLKDDTIRLALVDVLGIVLSTSDASFVTTHWAEGEALSPERSIFQRVQDRLAVTTTGTSTALNLWTLASERAQEGETSLDTLEAHISALRERRTRMGLATLLECSATQTPLLLIFEGAHWMDDASWALLESLASQLVGWPILTLVLVRPVGLAARRDCQHLLGEKVEARCLPLDNLDRTAAAALAQAHLGVAYLPDSVSDLLYARSQGNPLFLEELVHALREQGHLDVDPTDSQLAILQALTETPTTVSGVILSRIDQLPAGEQRVLKNASVIGREFLHDVLGHLVLQTMSPEALDDCLGALIRHRFIVELDTGAHRAFAFLHGLTQEVTYESLSLAERHLLHAAIGERLEVLFADELLAHCEELALHLGRAQVPDKAAIYLLMAGDKARSQGAYDRAQYYYRTALDVGDEDPTRAARAHEGLGDVWRFRSEYESALVAYSRALDLSPPDAALVARVRGQRGLVSPLAGRADLAVPDLEAGIATLAGEWRASLMGCRAWHAWQAGDATAAGQWCDQALALPDVSEPIQAFLRYVRGLVLGAEGVDDLEAARRVWLELGDADAVSLVDRAMALLVRDALHPADSDYAAIFRLATAPWL